MVYSVRHRSFRKVRLLRDAAALLAVLCSPAAAHAAQTSAVIVTRNAGLVTMVAHADPIVQFVMVLLLLASLATWTIWIVKSLDLTQAKRRLARDIVILRAAQNFQQAATTSYWATVEMVRTAQAELHSGGPAPSPRALEGIEERVAVQLPIIESRAIHQTLSGTNLLASIGATAPFVGLTGTVWGIMNSFLGIAQSHATSLAVVAPGIAEALLATAMGLAAAIPAVLIYNAMSRSIAGYRRSLAEAASFTLCVLSREIDRCAPQTTSSAATHLGGLSEDARISVIHPIEAGRA